MKPKTILVIDGLLSVATTRVIQKILGLHIVSEMSLVLSGPVTVEDTHLFDVQRTIAEIEVMKLCPRFGCNSPQMHRLPKKQADWLIRKIGRTGRRESSRSSRTFVQQTRRNNRSARR